MCSVAKLCLTLLWSPVAHKAPLSMGFPRQEHWSGLSFSSPGDLPDPGIKPKSPALAGRFFTTESPGKPKDTCKLFRWQTWQQVISQPINRGHRDFFSLKYEEFWRAPQHKDQRRWKDLPGNITRRMASLVHDWSVLPLLTTGTHPCRYTPTPGLIKLYPKGNFAFGVWCNLSQGERNVH